MSGDQRPKSTTSFQPFRLRRFELFVPIHYGGAARKRQAVAKRLRAGGDAFVSPAVILAAAATGALAAAGHAPPVDAVGGVEGHHPHAADAGAGGAGAPAALGEESPCERNDDDIEFVHRDDWYDEDGICSEEDASSDEEDDSPAPTSCEEVEERDKEVGLTADGWFSARATDAAAAATKVNHTKRLDAARQAKRRRVKTTEALGAAARSVGHSTLDSFVKPSDPWCPAAVSCATPCSLGRAVQLQCGLSAAARGPRPCVSAHVLGRR